METIDNVTHGNADEFEPTGDGEPGLLYGILNLPFIGETLAFILTVIPAGIIALVWVGIMSALAWIFGYTTDEFIETIFGVVSTLAVLVFAGIISFAWLDFLEEEAGVRMCLPIPFINIPIKWCLVAVAGALVVFVPIAFFSFIYQLVFA